MLLDEGKSVVEDVVQGRPSSSGGTDGADAVRDEAGLGDAVVDVDVVLLSAPLSVVSKASQGHGLDSRGVGEELRRFTHALEDVGDRRFKERRRGRLVISKDVENR